MARKPSKTAAGAENSAQTGKDTPTQIVQILEQQADTGLPLEKPAKGKGGRPSIFTQEIADIICIRISEGESLRDICKDDDMPSRMSVYRWLQANPEFCDLYTRAREDQADTLADEIVAIADEIPDLNPILDKHGALIEIQLHSAYIQWQKQRIDARKWTAMKLKPRKYGDKVQVGGDPENPLEVKNEAMDILAAAVKNLELKRQTANE